MNLFDKLVEQALINKKDCATLRIVVEKELFHQDILRILSQKNLLKNLTFIGGTALRSCYGSHRLSEDLDFTGGVNFSRESLNELKDLLVDEIAKKYGFEVMITEPAQDKTNVSTWRVRIQTRPAQKNLPSQHIHLDICSIPSYEKKPMLLLNPYGIDMGTTGLIIQTESKSEIYIDKLIAFALRPQLKFRDLWDMAWLHQQGTIPSYSLLTLKLQDHQSTPSTFKTMLEERILLVSKEKQLEIDFTKEMMRFLPKDIMDSILHQEGYWAFLTELLKEMVVKAIAEIEKD
jgi:predicted nucleotidyltransferase component of viral defense system